VWGRPWRPGIDDLTLRVTDANGDTLSVSLQVNVGARPDPTTDATVAGLQTAENEALKRLSTAQMQNVWSRLDGDVDCRPEWEQRIRLNAGWRDARPYGAPEAAAPGSADQRTCSRSLSMWAAGTVDYGRLAGSSASTGNRFSTPGLTAGVDLMPLSGLRSGIALGHGQDRSDLGAGSRVDSRSDSITAYGSWQAPLGVRVHAALGQARTALDLQRAPTAASSMLQGQRRVSQRYAALAGSTRVDVGAWQLAPRMGVEYMKASLDGVAEGDGSPLALAYDPARLASSDLRGGLALRRQWRQALWTVEPEFSLDWHRRLQGGLTQPLRYGDDPAAPAYLLQISDPTDEFALLGLGVRMQHPRGWSLSFGARSTLDSGALRSDGYTAAMLWPF
jgi:outer membrane autotransporter protein